MWAFNWNSGSRSRPKSNSNLQRLWYRGSSHEHWSLPPIYFRKKRDNTTKRVIVKFRNRKCFEAIPANIRLDEDVLKISFVSVFRRYFQDVLVKNNIFVLVIRLQDVFKMLSRRLQDVLQKHLHNIFKMSWRCYHQEMSSRHIQDILQTSLRRLQGIFKASWKDVFKTFSRSIIKLKGSC